MKLASILLLILLTTACAPATQSEPELDAPTATAVPQARYTRIDLPNDLRPRGVGDTWYVASTMAESTLYLY